MVRDPKWQGELAARNALLDSDAFVPSRQAVFAKAVRASTVRTLEQLRAFREGWRDALEIAGVEL